MKKTGYLILIAVLVLAAFYFYNNPQSLNDIWLWIVGLFGTIVKGADLLLKKMQGVEDSTPTSAKIDTPSAPNSNQVSNPQTDTVMATTEPVVDDFKGTTLELLRFSDDRTSTLGLLYINGQYFCHTLEDTFNMPKIPGQTRIPSGTYEIKPREVLSGLTEKYRKTYKPWFNWHLQLQNVPNFNYVYIHSGGTHKSTEGCILVSDSFSMGGGDSGKDAYFTRSRLTFEKLYKYLVSELDAGVKLRIIVRDETWKTKI